MPRTTSTTFRSYELGNKLQRELDRPGAGYGGGAKNCTKCKKLRGTLGGTNKNRKFICKECGNASTV